MPDIGGAVPDEHVAVRRKALVPRGFGLEQKVMGRRPLVVREVERRRSMGERDDHSAAGKHFRRIARIACRGIEAERVLDADLGSSKPIVVAEHAVVSARSVQSDLDLEPVVGALEAVGERQLVRPVRDEEALRARGLEGRDRLLGA